LLCELHCVYFAQIKLIEHISKGAIMAGKSSKARQAKLAKRKAKSKQKQKQGKMQSGGSELNSMINASVKNPIEFCGMNGALDQGMATVTIARSAGPDYVLMASFNVDLYCLGVKDSFINEVSREQFSDHAQSLTDLSPESAKTMIEGAIEFAKGAGFKPHKDFKRSYRIFKGVDADLSDDQYEFGEGGMPFYIQGPNDTPARVNEIIRTLENNCGVCGEDFHLTLVQGDTDDFMDFAE